MKFWVSVTIDADSFITDLNTFMSKESAVVWLLHVFRNYPDHLDEIKEFKHRNCLSLELRTEDNTVTLIETSLPIGGIQ